MSPTVRYKWRRRRFWLTFLLYWFTCTIGAGVLARTGKQRHEGAWVILVMLVLVAVCAATDRGGWRMWQRIVVVPGAWLAQAVLQIPAVFAVGMPIAMGRPEVVERMIGLAASVPVVIFAMRHSRLFVAPAGEGLGSAVEG